MNLYLKGIHPTIQSTCAEFDRLCREHDVPYIIVEDSPAKQVYKLGRPDKKIVTTIKEYADLNGAAVTGDDQNISVLTGNGRRPQKCFVAVIDDDVQSKMMEALLYYMGSRHNQLINESFKELEV